MVRGLGDCWGRVGEKGREICYSGRCEVVVRGRKFRVGFIGEIGLRLEE